MISTHQPVDPDMLEVIYCAMFSDTPVLISRADYSQSAFGQCQSDSCEGTSTLT